MRFLALFFCLVLPLTALAQTTTQADSTIAIEESASQDAAIAKRIRAILRELEGYDKVTVDVSSGIVTLRGTTVDNVKTTQLTELVGRVEGVVATENEVRESTDVVERLNPAIDRFKARLIQMVAFLPMALIALAIFGVIVAVGFAVARMERLWDRLAPNAFIADIYRQILRLLFVICGLVVALDVLNATALLSGILGAAGIAGLAIGFAVRDTVENFIASIMLSIRQPFRPNDLVEIEGDIGMVIRLTSRATILLNPDGNHIRLPNSVVFKARIINYTRNAERRFIFGLGVAPDTNLVGARDLALSTLRELPFVLDEPEPLVWIDAVGDSTINFQVAGWVDQTSTNFLLARSEAIRMVVGAFETAGYALPEPTYRLLHLNRALSQEEKRQAKEAAAEPGRPALVPSEDRPSPPAPPQPQDVTSAPDRELEKIVEQERADPSRPDLLSRHASEE